MKRVAALSATLLMLPLAGHAAGYLQADLSADTQGTAAYTDVMLKNPWGLSVPPEKHSAEAFWWAADNVSGVSTLYDSTGATRQLVVTIPAADGKSTGSPTGTVNFNKNFVFVTEDGTISQWVYNDYNYNSAAKRLGAAAIANIHSASGGGVQPDTKTNCQACHVSDATLMVKQAGAAFEGVTVAKINGTDTLLVANVTQAEIQAFDANFAPVTLPSGAFTDPELPSGFTATNVQSAGGLVWVVYVSDAGGGYVNGYSRAGKLLVRLQQGNFDDPWGIAVAPSNFGDYSSAVLVGNVSSGKIGAYSKTSGQFLGFLSDTGGKAIVNPGLWAIAFGLGNRNNGPSDVLYFNAGGDSQTHGLFGSLTASP